MPSRLHANSPLLLFIVALAFSPGGVAVAGASEPQEAVAEIRFEEMFARPVGPRGLELSAAVRALEGRRVRIRGFMVAREAAPPGSFLLAPFPIQLHETEYGLADDLPPTVLVESAAWRGRTLTLQPGPIAVTGILQLGNREEPDGRVSSLRLLLDGSDPVSDSMTFGNKETRP